MPSLLERVLKNALAQFVLALGSPKRRFFCILDAQSVKNTDTAKAKGDDADKKVSGIKRHLAVE